MGVHVEWASAAETTVEIVRPDDDWSDAYGQRIAPGKLGLALSSSDVVMIEGTPDELRALAQRVTQAVDEAEAESR